MFIRWWEGALGGGKKLQRGEERVDGGYVYGS